MTVLELRVQHFRQHRQAAFRFAWGFNAVVGPNEAGKSALRDALRLALFGNPAAESLRRDPTLRPWGAEAAPVLELVFEVPEGRFELVKDFGTGRVLLRGGGKTWEHARQVQQALHRALGFHSEKAFLATAHVRQAELEKIGERDVAVQLGRIVAGADQDATRALRALQQALQDLERGVARPASNPGRLKQARDRLRELEDRVATLRRQVAQARQDADHLARLQQRRQEVEAELEARTELLEFNRQVQRAREQRDQLRQQLQDLQARLDRLSQLEDELRQARRELEQLPAVDPQTVQRVRTALDQADELDANAAQVEREGDFPSPRAAPLWPWLAAVVLAGAALWPGVPGPLRGALVVAAAAAAGIGVWRFESSRRVRAERQARRRERLRLAEQLRGQARELRARARADLEAAGAESAEQLHEWAARRQELEGALRSLQQRLHDVLGDRDPDQLDQERKSLSADLYILQQFLDSDPVRTKALLPLELQRREQEVQRLRKEHEELSRQVQRLELQLEGAPDEEALLRAEEEQAACQREVDRLERRARALRVAEEVLREAKAAVEVPARRAVEERAGRFLDRLTAGRYTQVRVPPEADTLRLEVWSEEARRWIPPEEPYLSRGTVDLVFLAARVALVDVLAPATRPPLLLDDPFVAFDPGRRQRALEWVREVSQDRQVLLFTCDPRVAEYADAVVSLPGPGAPGPVLDWS